MKKERQGFTLVEILAVIVVIGLLLLLIAPAILNQLNSQTDNIKTTQIQILEDIAAVYMDSDKETYLNVPNNVYCITVADLIANGFIQEEFKDATDTTNTYNDKTIKVTINEEGAREYEIVETGNCTQKISSDVALKIGPVSNTTWSPYKYVEIMFPDLGSGYEKQYSTNGGSTWSTSSAKYVKTDDFKTETTVCARILKNNVEETRKCETVKNIDSTPPTCSIIAARDPDYGSWYNSAITITLNPSDTGGSGLKTKGLTTSAKRTYNEVKSAPINSNFSGIYYGYVRDNAGNVGSCQKNMYLDMSDPSCSISLSRSADYNGWYNSSVTVYLASSDTGGSKVGSKGLSSSGYTYNGYTSRTAYSSGRYYGIVRDNAGNENSCSSSYLNIDTTAPSVYLSVSSRSAYYNTTTVNYSMTASDDNGIYRYCITTESTCTPSTSYPSSGVSSTYSIASSYDGAQRTLRACVYDVAGNKSCDYVYYTVYKNCTYTENSGSATCGTYGSCQCPAGLKYATKTQDTVDSYTGATCGTTTTTNGCSTSCTCDTSIQIQTCRQGNTCINTIKDHTDCTYTVTKGTKLKVEEAGYANGVDWYKIVSGTYSGNYIAKSCTSTGATCSASDCPDL